ncbi:hypothetical protein GCK72_025788 [Caenorhabditis remanei]|uniref:Uncharacterized protein n=1 Tax=Caenorhabditis remanei TaxID=31234 RepID=A0A6A5G3M2_CAERE|nr:hypothetical protein GCK72_025788 [Caenorhabditis remanei]KAF1749321.1 hypothetical protein GCK72_025788 [Caenorhabditis remanei]
MANRREHNPMLDLERIELMDEFNEVMMNEIRNPARNDRHEHHQMLELERIEFMNAFHGRMINVDRDPARIRIQELLNRRANHHGRNGHGFVRRFENGPMDLFDLEFNNHEEEDLDNLVRFAPTETDGRAPYILQARKAQNELHICNICLAQIPNIEYLKHLDDCAEKRHSLEHVKNAAYYHFLSSEYYVHQEFAKLMENLEIRYLSAVVDESFVKWMPCMSCDTLMDHLSEKCMKNNMEEIFTFEGKTLVNRSLNNYKLYLEYNMQVRLDGIVSRHSKHLDSIESILDMEPTDIESQLLKSRTWDNFVNVTCPAQHVEIFEFKEKTMLENEEMLEKEENSLDSLFLKNKNRMVAYIETFKKKENLREILQQRKSLRLDPIDMFIPSNLMIGPYQEGVVEEEYPYVANVQAADEEMSGL